MYRSHIGRQQAAHNAVNLVDVVNVVVVVADRHVDNGDVDDDVWHLISIGTARTQEEQHVLMVYII